MIFQIEEEASPTYKIENGSDSIWMEYFQQGHGLGSDSSRETLAPGKSAAYSWTDPERAKGKKVLCCHLELLNRSEGKLKTMQKLEIELDNAEYSQTFIGRFVDDDLRHFTAGLSKGRRQTQPSFRRALQGPGAPPEVEEGVCERIVKIEVLAEGYTKTLRLTERQSDSTATPRGAALARDEGPSRGQGEAAQLPQTLAPLKARAPTKGKQESRLESIDDPDVLYEVAEKRERANKFQLDIGMMHLSFIARNDKNTRREFLLAYLEAIEFLAVEAGDSKDLQLRVAYVQLDNNIHSEGRQLFPFVMYPKEI